MSHLKVLVVSTKGGVGKSTISMQLVAPYLYEKNSYKKIKILFVLNRVKESAFIKEQFDYYFGDSRGVFSNFLSANDKLSKKYYKDILNANFRVIDTKLKELE